MKDDPEGPNEGLVPSPNRGLARASGLVRRGLDDLVRRQGMEWRPERRDLTLKNEARTCHKNPQWALIEQVIRDLDTGYGNSFCRLEAGAYDYIQSLHGFNGYHLEWSINSTTDNRRYILYRASYPGGSSEIVELRKHDGYANPGEHRDLLQIDAVLDAFRAFYRAEGKPPSLEWRMLDI